MQSLLALVNSFISFREFLSTTCDNLGRGMDDPFLSRMIHVMILALMLRTNADESPMRITRAASLRCETTRYAGLETLLVITWPFSSP